ncbi:hypothetical protein L1887_50719 [Cichorium endivia]|nr:hypothetical protein L1887_50719 [Cichorium endivia]
MVAWALVDCGETACVELLEGAVCCCTSRPKGLALGGAKRCEGGCEVWERVCVIGRVVLFQGEGRKLLMGRCARRACQSCIDRRNGTDGDASLLRLVRTW